jgi:hypothetical protein
LNEDCSSSKVGDDYVANVMNLQDDGIQTLMAQADITAADVMAIWDAWGWSYDHDEANRVITASVESTNWGSVKQLFR